MKNMQKNCAPKGAPVPAETATGQPDELCKEFVNETIRNAIKDKATELSFDFNRTEFIVRARYAGQLVEVSRLPKTQGQAVIARLKSMIGVDRNFVLKTTLDGRVMFQFDGREFDLRINMLLSYMGESTNIQILDKNAPLIKLNAFGLTPHVLASFERIIKSVPEGGLHIISGPSGCGKTTLLYALILELITPERKLFLLEEQVEYLLDGVAQIQVNPAAGLTYASALRAIQRQNPDVVVVNELRDLDSLQLLIQFALCGKMAFGVLHTNDAVSTIARMMDMGVKPHLMTGAVKTISNARLVRCLCKHCKQSYTPSDVEFSMGELDPAGTYFKPNGCAECRHTGFRGRRMLIEVLEFNDAIRSMIYNGASNPEILQAAQLGGMKTLRQDGFIHAANGDTSIDEVLIATQKTF